MSYSVRDLTEVLCQTPPNKPVVFVTHDDKRHDVDTVIEWDHQVELRARPQQTPRHPTE